MRKKIIISIILIITIFQSIIPIKANAFIEEIEIESTPARIEQYKAEDEVNEATGVDTITGLMLEPTVELLTVVADSIMSVFSAIMTLDGNETFLENFQNVMVKKDELPEIEEEAEATYTITSDELENYQRIGGLDIKYPNFPFSAEEIFAGKIDLLSIDFISGNSGVLVDQNGNPMANQHKGWNNLRRVIGEWYKILRMIAIIGLLSVLIYTGIKIIIASNSSDKAKYKEMIINWVVAVVLAFTMHYIMAFIINIVNGITGLLAESSGKVQVNAGGTEFITNLIGLARFQMQQINFTAKVGHLIIYIALVVYTFKFTFIYFKRVLKMAFLTIISPIVALTYPIDKMNGKAQGFNMWLREYIFNALLQLVHCILYYVLVSTSLSLAVNNPLYGIVALMFISQAERLLKKIFGFDKAKGQTVGGLAGAFTTGVITSKLTKLVKDPLHPFGGGNNSLGNSGGSGNLGKNGGQLAGGNNYYNESEELYGTINDTHIYEFLPNNTNENSMPRSIFDELGIDTSIGWYRQYLSQYSDEELGGLNFEEDESVGNIDDMIALLHGYQRKLNKTGRISDQTVQMNEQLARLRDSSLIANEMSFSNSGIPLQYIDGDSRSTSDLINEVIRLNKLADNRTLPASKRREHAKEAERLLKIVKRRMTENEHIQKQGGPQALMQQNIMNTHIGSRSIGQRRAQNLQQSENIQAQQQQSQQQSQNMQTQQQQRNRQRSQSVQEQQQQRNRQQVQNVQEQQQQSQNVQTQSQRRQQSKKRKKKAHPIARGMQNVGKTLSKPIWDFEKGAKYNGSRLVGKTIRGITGITVGVTAAAVQAGVSITDGKYNPLEGVATIGAGITGVSKIGNLAENKRQTYLDSREGKTVKRYSEQWFNNDDVINNYNKSFPGQGKEMRQRAVKNYISRGITDFQEQKKAIKFAELLRDERGMDIEEADRLAIATLQYKKDLIKNKNYKVLYDYDKRSEYLDVQADTYTGATSKDAVRQLHDVFIENVRDFDRANK